MEKLLWCFLGLISFSNAFVQKGKGCHRRCQRFDVRDRCGMGPTIIQTEFRGTFRMEERVGAGERRAGEMVTLLLDPKLFF